MKQLKRKTKESLVAYLCISPTILGIMLLMVAPIIAVVVISFTDWSVLNTPKFIGFKNYNDIFNKDIFFYKSVLETLYFAVGSVVASIIFSFFVAIMLNMDIPARGFFRSVFFVPAIVPSIAALIVWSWMYEPTFGLFNYFLGNIGAPKSMWIYGESTSIPSLILIMVWSAGNLIVVFQAGLDNIPKSYLEAVEIDGGNFWHKFKNVIVPMMTPIIFFNVLMNMVTNLQVFTPSFLLTMGGPNNSTLFLVYLIMREAFKNNNTGYACALAFLFFICVSLVTALIFYSSKKWVYYEGK